MNPQLFRHGSLYTPPATIFNAAGGKAYEATPEHTLAQYAVTGCLNDTFYSTAEVQLDKVLELAGKVSTEYLAKVAVYARQHGHMKDMPALLLGVLVTRDPRSARKVFDRVVDNPKMLKNFVTIMRSGAVGRKSLGTTARHLVQGWLSARSPGQLFRGIVGGDVSLRDVIRLAHPKSPSAERAAFYRYVLGFSDVDLTLLPDEAQAFEAFKKDPSGAPPDVAFQLLSNLKLSADQWRSVAGNMSWQTLRMNLNTLQRNGCFESVAFITETAKRLADPAEVAKSKCFPFQLLSAFNATKASLPREISNALQDAMEHATKNVPAFEGKTIVGVDVSGSMSSAVTGTRKGATSTVCAIDAAALFGSAILRNNPNAEVYPFDTSVYNPELNGRDSVMTNTTKLAHYGGGGTDCSILLSALSHYNQKADTIILVSDNESWVDSRPGVRGTNTMRAWELFKRDNPKAKLVCIDIQPNVGLQVVNRSDILNVGGFSDSVFDVVAAFTRGELTSGHWTSIINKIEI